ncbi:conjugal transfer protein TraW [Halomonas elongata]|uniref:conjugal transfer protein TraW n=1 Tax=Halomonas elongata TaxID=2746 RepID=UPI00255AA715|nr:conjugal transfer protein TraW [Halomonas elongata]MDL4860708.1 conjugal transfer protein TraW [Halomonas elongata]
MNIKNTLKPLAAGLMLVSAPSYAVYPVSVTASVPMTQFIAAQWTPFVTSLQATLQQLGGAINSSAQQVSSSVQTASEAERHLAVKQAYNERLYQARTAVQIPSSICVESASGGASPAAAGATRNRTSIEGGGGGASLATLNEASNLLVNGPAKPADIAALQTASSTSEFCSPADAESYGGTNVCPSANTEMPAADKRVASVLLGAGPYGKTEDATFTQEQADVARLYVRNSTRRNIAPQVAKGEASTPAGQAYIGTKTQYQSMVSAAEQPAIQAIASRMPVPSTEQFISDALETPSAQSYWNATASDEAKNTGTVSYHELEKFEVGRRYSNVAYGQDLQGMSGDNLIRELIRVEALNAHLTLGLKQQIEQANIISGQQLASMARTEYEPILQAQLQEIYGSQ